MVHNPKTTMDIWGYMSLDIIIMGNGGSSEARFYNPSLKWEKNYATNIGIDLTLFNRLTVSAEWYNRETKDLLMDKPISAAVGVINSSGVANMLVNVGSRETVVL
ncbi:TonB-dependent receptor, partial [Bacteroides fragilis]|nr:TonB-dependent receptor [Bacteroides fragilis]